MAEQYIDIGSDKDISITLKDENGTAEDVSAYEGYGIILYYERDGTVLAKYSKNAVTGWDNTNITTTNEASGIVVLHLLRSVTELGRKGGRVKAQAVLQIADAAHTTSQFRDIGDPIYIFTFRNELVASPTVDMS